VNYTIRLLLIQHDVDNDDETKSRSTVEDGCLLLAIGAAIGAAVLLTVTIIVATTVCFYYHRKPSFYNKRVRALLCWCFILLICRFSMPYITKFTGGVVVAIAGDLETEINSYQS